MIQLPEALEEAFYSIPDLDCGEVTHETALPPLNFVDDKEPDPDTVTLSGMQLTL